MKTPFPNFLSSQLPSASETRIVTANCTPTPANRATLLRSRRSSSVACADGEVGGKFCRDVPARSVSDEGVSGSPLIPGRNLGLCEIFRKLTKGPSPPHRLRLSLFHQMHDLSRLMCYGLP